MKYTSRFDRPKRISLPEYKITAFKVTMSPDKELMLNSIKLNQLMVFKLLTSYVVPKTFKHEFSNCCYEYAY